MCLSPHFHIQTPSSFHLKTKPSAQFRPIFYFFLLFNNSFFFYTIHSPSRATKSCHRVGFFFFFFCVCFVFSCVEMFCLSKCGVECIYVFRIGKSQERPNVADWPQGGTDRPSEGHPSSSSVSQAREDSRIWIESCVWSWFQQSRESPVHPLATSREESPLFRLSVISLVRNTNRKSVNSVYLSLFIRCGCIQPLGLHNKGIKSRCTTLKIL